MTWLLTTLTPLLKTGMEAVLENWSGSFRDYSSQSCHFCFFESGGGAFFIPFAMNLYLCNCEFFEGNTCFYGDNFNISLPSSPLND